MQLNQFLTTAVEQNASDLHLSSGSPPTLRIDGELQPLDAPPLNPEMLKRLFYEILTDSQQKHYEKALEIDFAYTLSDQYRFRVNLFHHEHGISGAFRTLPAQIPSLDQLELPNIFKDLCNLSNGLVLITGPTGSGKSTTLAAMIHYINQNHKKHIITIEDPIEFSHKGQKSLISQREVYRDTKSFDRALRAALREDPDVILVGEMRDLETIRLTMTAAETGHLVLATLHTNSAAKSIDRLIGVFDPKEKDLIRGMLSESLQAVIAQALMKKPEGGRVAAFELMLCSPAIRNLIRENKIAQIYSAIQTSQGTGMCTMEQYIEDLIAKNVLPAAPAQLKHRSQFHT